ncbi:S-adenosyl-L-methionine-dependent methyltransferase [Hypoxylon cercidicola]|nr:S-adenosyl-L-methionine-dependent methyltransferase [Hypoxylon cercidicola]
MAPLRSVSELASIIERHTQTVETELKGTPGTEFSLAFGAPPQINVPPSLEATRGELLETIDELRARLLGPLGYLMATLLPTPALIGILHTLYAFDIASHIPLGPDAEISYEELAERCGIPEDDTRRVVQAAIAFRIFEEATPEVSVRHNAISSTFVSSTMKAMMGLFIEDQCSGVYKLVESLKRFPGSGEPGHSALVLAFRESKAVKEGKVVDQEIADPSKSIFDYISEDEQRVARFRSVMGMSTKSLAYRASYFTDNLPWTDENQCPTTVADIGGAGGEICQAILRSYPDVKKAYVLDLPEVVADAKAPEDLEGRLEFESYNFITEKMTRDADVYVFRHIFHDWSDQYGAKILKNLVPALKEGSKIWISEVVLPNLSDRNHMKDQTQRGADILMKCGFNSKERSKRGWETLLAMADERLRITSITRPDGAHDAVIEIVFDA